MFWLTDWRVGASTPTAALAFDAGALGAKLAAARRAQLESGESERAAANANSSANASTAKSVFGGSSGALRSFDAVEASAGAFSGDGLAAEEEQESAEAGTATPPVREEHKTGKKIDLLIEM